MRAISLWQPWASLLVSGRKVHETRHWITSHRGSLYIHAAKRQIREADLTPELRAICEDQFGGHFWKDLPFGAVIGVGTLVDCHRTEDWTPKSRDDRYAGNWADGRFAWEMRNVVPIGPWPYKGRQGLFNVNDLDDVANRCLGITSAKEGQQK